MCCDILTSVRDNGVGLPDNSGLDLFSLFSRGTTAVTGHGIGLATVSRIVEAHGGRVGATPVETGAEVWFEVGGSDQGPVRPRQGGSTSPPTVTFGESLGARMFGGPQQVRWGR